MGPHPHIPSTVPHPHRQMLCEATADLSLGCKAFGRGNTALHQATILSDVAMIKLLVQHGADVDAQVHAPPPPWI
jgi:ankyrin repeat protein